MNLVELIDVREIAESLIDYSEETIRRYFRCGILYAYEMVDGRKIVTSRGSAKIRLKAFGEISRKRPPRDRVNMKTAGKILTQAAGKKDEFISKKLAQGVPIVEIQESYINKINEILGENNG